MRRRELLAVAASAFAAAGCLDGREPGGAGSTATGTPTPTEAPTNTPTESPTDTQTGEASVEAVALDALQPGIIELGTPDSIGVFGGSDGQYLFLDVTPGADAPDPAAFAFELDGESHPPVEETRGIWRAYHAEPGAQYDPDSGGWLLFELPATADDPATARLAWPGGSWRPAAAARERLATPAPPFDVTVDVPGTVPAGEIPTLTVTAENAGTVAGRYLLAVNRVGPHVAYAPEAAVRLLIEPGESKTWTGKPSFRKPAEISAGDTTRLTFDWLGGETDREIEFASG